MPVRPTRNKRRPGRPSTGGRVAHTVSVSLLPGLYQGLEAMAQEAHCSLGKMLAKLLERELQTRGARDGDTGRCI